MRFGVFVPQGWRLDLAGIEPDRHWAVMNGLAQRIDADPAWESLWVYDHFHTVPKPSDEATHEAWSLMAAYAASTTRVRLGQMCTCMSYRNPAYLAKVAATIDVVSGGRVEMGIGGGWYEHEWRAYGYGFPGARDRLGRLREGVEIFRQMWTQGRATYAGKHYSVDGAICAPRPLQGTSVPGSPANGIPMWVAGGGEKVTLRIAARYADYTNFFGNAAEFAHKDAVLRGHCEAIGRDAGEIVRSANFNVFVGRDEREVTERLKQFVARRVEAGLREDRVRHEADDMRRTAGAGTPEQIVEGLREYAAAGLGYTIAYFPEAAYDQSGIDLFAREVIPALAG